MANNLCCIIDASGSMNVMRKYDQALKAATSLSLLSQSLTARNANVLDVSSVDCWYWQQGLMSFCDFKGRPTGQANLQSLLSFLQEHCNDAASGAEEVSFLLFTDGRFYDPEGLAAVSAFWQQHPQLRLAIIGVGADQDSIALRTIAGESGNVFALQDIPAALSYLHQRHLPTFSGVAAAIAPLLAADEGNEDDEEDAWDA